MDATELTAIVESILDPSEETTSADLDSLLETFIDSIPHPGGSDLIFYPEYWGLGPNPSPEEVSQAALSWRPQILVMSVRFARKHPRRKDLICLGVEIEGRMQTQVVSSLPLQVGDRCVVALSGCELPDGSRVCHGFVDRVYSAGQFMGVSDKPVGTVVDPSEV